MTIRTLFADLIKDLTPFDRKLVRILDKLRTKQHGMTIQTSRFELCRLLGLTYCDSNTKRLDDALGRLARQPFYLPGPSGFARATRAVEGFYWENDSEKLIISLGKLFLI